MPFGVRALLSLALASSACTRHSAAWTLQSGLPSGGGRLLLRAGRKDWCLHRPQALLQAPRFGNAAATTCQSGGGGGDNGGIKGRGRGSGGRGDSDGDGDGDGERHGHDHRAGGTALESWISRRELLAGMVAAMALLGQVSTSTASMLTDAWMDRPFSAQDIPEVWQSDPPRHAIVTGSNTGIGLETAAELARKGWVVTLACRNQAKGEAAVQEIR